MEHKNTTALEKLANRCAEAGLNLTEPRMNVARALIQADKPRTAYEIIDTVGDVKPMTVYRALEFLTTHGFAHRIESLNAYMICEENHCAHKNSQYLVCDSCNTVEELHNHALDDFIDTSLKQSGFTPKQKTIEIHGTCGVCNAA